MSARHMCFTINNYTEQTEHTLGQYFEDKKNKCNYMVFGREVAPSTGTAHIQGYLQWTEPKKTSAFSKKFKAFVEAARGSSTEASEYCKKEGNFTELGIMTIIDKKAAQKNNSKKGGDKVKEIWDSARSAAKEGRFDDIPSDIYIRYQASIRRIYQENQPKPKDLDGELKNMWIWGEPGVGKSKLARLIAESKEYYYTKSRNKWWDNYNGEAIVILDEVGPKDKDWIGDFLKIWCDRYVFQAEYKGSSKLIRPPHIIITSNYSIDEVFPKSEDEMLNLAVHRRIKSLKLIGTFNDDAMNQLKARWQEWLGFKPPCPRSPVHEVVEVDKIIEEEDDMWMKMAEENGY